MLIVINFCCGWLQADPFYSVDSSVIIVNANMVSFKLYISDLGIDFEFNESIFRYKTLIGFVILD